MLGYERVIELKMQRLFATLPEMDRRRYAGIEAAKPGHGGIEYISGWFERDPETARRGMAELEQTDDSVPNRVRKVGGGQDAARLGRAPPALEPPPHAEPNLIREVGRSRFAEKGPKPEETKVACPNRFLGLER